MIIITKKNMKNKIILFSVFIILITGLYYVYNSKQPIPEKYVNPKYCKIDSDCKYEVQSFCCNTVVNKYNKSIDLI
jgi:hypothetical protein